jgi:signal recognition particle subunit SRP68
VIENPPSIGVSQDQAAFLRERLRGLVQRYRALVMLGKQQASPEVGSRTVSEKSLVERLAEYPAEGVSLDNIVVYPPQMEPVPVKPLFLDVAWNYIAYPSMDGTKKEHSRAVRGSEATTAGEEKQPQKRGWFGFGR